jgi:hypothetical protein
MAGPRRDTPGWDSHQRTVQGWHFELILNCSKPEKRLFLQALYDFRLRPF